MAHVIGEACIKDAACVEVCPTDAIHPTKDEDGFDDVEMMYIDPELCTDCGTCVDECPTEAIFLEDDVPEDQKEYIEKNAEYFKQKA